MNFLFSNTIALLVLFAAEPRSQAGGPGTLGDKQGLTRKANVPNVQGLESVDADPVTIVQK